MVLYASSDEALTFEQVDFGASTVAIFDMPSVC